MRVSEKIGEGIPLDFDIAMYGSGLYVNYKKCEVLARVREPYFRRTYKTFTSHQYAPAAKDSPYPAIAQSESGQVVYIYSPIFAAYYKYGYGIYRKLVRNCIELLLGDRLLTADAPLTSEILLNEKDGKKLIHVVNFQSVRVGKHPEYVDEYYPVEKIVVKVKVGREPEKIYSATTGREPTYKMLPKGYIEISLERCELYEVIVIEGG